MTSDAATGDADPASGVGSAAPSAGEMTLVEHLTELRDRLFRSALAVVVGSAIGYAIFPEILDFLLEPYCAVDSAFRPDGPESQCVLVATRPLDAFSLRIKASAVFGLFVAGPVLFYQLWRFIAPGLTGREKRYALPFVVGSQLMFAGGIAFSYYVIPQGLNVLLGFAGPLVTPLLNAAEYLSFLLTTAVAFGLVFEVPLVLVFLSLVGVVTASGLAHYRAYAIVGNAILAAIVTPTTDFVTMMFMLAPMVVFYELAILSARLIERSRRRRDRRAGSTT